MVRDLLIPTNSLLRGLLGRISSSSGCALRLLLNTLLHGLSRGLGLLGHAIGLNSVSLSGLLDGVNLVRAVVTDEVGEVLNSSGARVVDRGVLLASLEELDGREACDLVWNVVGSSVDLGNNNLVGVVLVHGSQLVVLGGEGLAVSAPRSVELEKDILLVVHHNILVVLGHNNSDWTLLLLWDRLALDRWLNLASNEVLEKLANLLLADRLGVTGVGVRELLVLGDVLDGEGGPLADLEVEVAGVLAKGGGVDGGEVDLALVLLSDGLEGVGERSALFGGLGEDVGERNAGLESESVSNTSRTMSQSFTYSHVAGVGLRANLANQWSGGGLRE